MSRTETVGRDRTGRDRQVELARPFGASGASSAVVVGDLVQGVFYAEPVRHPVVSAAAAPRGITGLLEQSIRNEPAQPRLPLRMPGLLRQLLQHPPAGELASVRLALPRLNACGAKYRHPVRMLVGQPLNSIRRRSSHNSSLSSLSHLSSLSQDRSPNGTFLCYNSFVLHS